MTTDLKDMYQSKADELALENYETEFYDLPNGTQMEVYNLAMELVHDRLAAQADLRRKEETSFKPVHGASRPHDDFRNTVGEEVF